MNIKIEMHSAVKKYFSHVLCFHILKSYPKSKNCNQVFVMTGE